MSLDYLWLFGIFCGHWVYSKFIWYIVPVLVCCTKKNLATLIRKSFNAGEKNGSEKDGISMTIRVIRESPKFSARLFCLFLFSEAKT
jgi:hypothetical protein